MCFRFHLTTYADLGTSTLKRSVQVIPKPTITPGSALFRVLNANVIGYAHAVYSGVRNFPIPTPLVIGSSAIGPIEAVGSDATLLAAGQVIWIDSFIRGRDDPTANMLFGYREGITEGSKKLMSNEWRDATYAEFDKVPLENYQRIDEERLLGDPRDGGLAYWIEDLAYLTIQVVVAMGAKVIATGRSLEALRKLAATSDRVKIAHLKCVDGQADLHTLKEFGQVDAYLDWSAPGSGQYTHRKLSVGGQVRWQSLAYGRNKRSYQVTLFGDHAPQPSVARALHFKLGSAEGYKESPKFPLEEWEQAASEAERISKLELAGAACPSR
ncbi:MAG: hypothetical protein Q9166_003292 [cf. Caloplaca sp. 2 TL-2023]